VLPGALAHHRILETNLIKTMTAFNERHVTTYSKYVGKPLNILNANGEKIIPPDHLDAQTTIKEAHSLVKVWAQGIRAKLFPLGTDPEKNITATNQRGNFRDYLPQTFQPSIDSSKLISYWVYLWCDRKSESNDIYFRVALGVNDDKADSKLKRKVIKVRQKFGGEERFLAQLPALEGIKFSMDQLVAWGVDAIQNFALTYDQFCAELEPELSANKNTDVDPTVSELSVNYWIEKTIVTGRPDRETGTYRLGEYLWSPQQSRGERPSDIYSNMRKVKPGDVVIHFTDNRAITGVSIVAQNVDESFQCLADTEWAGLAGYSVKLKDYVRLDKEITREEIFDHGEELKSILAQNKGLFFNKDLNLVQGGYLTAAPLRLVHLFSDIFQESSGQSIPHIELEVHMNLESAPAKPYGFDDALSGLLIPRAEFIDMIEAIKNKRNLILQGPPGTGKSFVAKRLAYAILGAKDDGRIQSIQFHQSFSYEDFIQGYRPKKDASGFALRDGVFYRFCELARNNPTLPFVFLIDEINRGNLSKIFGEVMLLIESDKRGPEWAVSLTYADEVSKKFYIPDNVHIIGMMNTADRSLAIVDYALRRRFVFKDVPPGFSSPDFKSILEGKSVTGSVVDVIQQRIVELNKKIEASPDLGVGFMVGHSFFIPTYTVTDSEAWYNGVIRNELSPLLREYWFDKKKSEVDQEIDLLLIK
jgi:hypothetical protein